MFGLFGRKGPFDAKVLPSGKVITVQAGENLLKAGLEAGLAWPHDCRVGSCGTCRTKLLSGKIKPLNDFSYVLDGEELDAGIILACQTALRSDIEVEVQLGDDAEQTPVKTVEGAISGYRHLTHDIVELSVELDEPLPKYLAGQYADLAVPGVIDKPRNYSFAAAPNGADVKVVSFFVRLVPGGEMTTWLHEQDRTGTRVAVSGPYGDFHLRESPAPVLCIAGGSGLAPIRALLEQMAAEGYPRQTRFLFGARTQKDLYCLEEMRAHKDRANGQFEFVPVLSEEPEDSDWQGRRGLVTEFVSEMMPDVQACQAYLCGPPPMVDAAIATLGEQGLGEESIFYDKFLDASHMPGGR
jgi:CDP-4-dehydro-6-deoxyglucose reductase